MLDQLLKEHGGELVAAVTQGSQLDAPQAERLVPPALGQLAELVTGSGGIDLSELLRGGPGIVSEVLSKLDVGSIADRAGLEKTEAQDGLSSLIPVVVSLLGDEADGVEGLLSMLGGEGGGGGLGALGGIAGKLFGK